MFNDKRTNYVRAAIETKKWIDPFTEFERWLYQTPIRFMEDTCSCGSNLPVLWWSPDGDSACFNCKGSLMVYIPEAMLWNLCNKLKLSSAASAELLTKWRELEADNGTIQ